MQKLYEQRSYKKAVKEADKVLKAHPNHGGTTAMKALCVSLMGKKEEAMALAKDAVKFDLRCGHAVVVCACVRVCAPGIVVLESLNTRPRLAVCLPSLPSGTNCAGTCTAC
jgi:hypothetical protein